MLNLLSLIYSFIKKKRPDSLNCGIFGWVGTSSDKFSPFMFNVLGIYNDSRGGDSCGVYFNRNSINGIKTEAKYETLVKTNKLHTTIKPGKWPIVIGHCRKASVGSVIEVNVQPVLLRKTSDKKLVYVQAHNGTIYNYDDLAKKYSINLEKDESDSIALAKLIERKGFDVLKEYDGSAALLMHFVKEPNVLYAFHGQSRYYNNTTEERPLHYLSVKNSGTYISSEAGPLEFIANGEKAVSFKPNIVYRLEGDKVEEFLEIKRDTASQRKYESNFYSNARNYSNDNYDYYHTNNNKGKEMKLWNDDDKSFYSLQGITRNICCSNVEANLINLYGDNRVVFRKGFYWKGTNYLHGEVTCDAWGYFKTPSTTNSTLIIYYLYFCYGILLRNRESYLIMEGILQDLNVKTTKEFHERTNFNKIEIGLRKHSFFPFTRISETPNSGFVQPSSIIPGKDKGKTTYFTGNFNPLFTDFVLHFNMGDLLGYKKNVGLYTLDDLITDFPDAPMYDNFGINTSSNDKKNITSCEECYEKGFYGTGLNCQSCDMEYKDRDHLVPFNKRDEEEQQAMVVQVIAEGLPDIMDSIEDLVDEINVTGAAYLVTKELNLLTEANNKLKEIITS